MVYIVCLAFFIALGAWLVSTYSRFHHLYTQVQSSWMQWVEATRERNVRLGDFARLFSVGLPKDAMLPRDLRRLVDDSGRALKELDEHPGHGNLRKLGEGEKRLRHAMSSSLIELENNSLMRDDHQLLQLFSETSVSMVQQEQFAHFYNRHAEVYNNALAGPGGRLFGAMMGFTPVERIQTVGRT